MTLKCTPTQSLILEVLAARYRLGEVLWTFDSRNRKAVDGLENAGLVWQMHGAVEHTIRVGLTEAGKEFALDPSYTPRQPVGEEEFAVESKTFDGGPWDRIDTGSTWSSRNGKPYTRVEAEAEVTLHDRHFPGGRRVVHRFVGPWEPPGGQS